MSRLFAVALAASALLGNAFAEVPIAGGVTGNPVLIQSRFGVKGNFEVIVPSDRGGLYHYFRENDREGLPWGGPVWLFPELEKIEGVGFTQSNFEEPGNLEVLINTDGKLLHAWRKSTPPYEWKLSPTPIIAEEVRGVPSIIQSSFGEKGNFEVAVPLKTGGIGLLIRNNDKLGYPWEGMVRIGEGLYDSVSLIQSNYNDGNLEVMARQGETITHFWRDTLAGPWKGGNFIGARAAGNPVLIQSTWGEKGNFELLYANVEGGLTSLYRDNDKNPPVWHGPTEVPTGSLRNIEAIGFIQSNYLDPGNLEVLVRSGKDLHLVHRKELAWQPPQVIATAIDETIKMDSALTKAYTEHLGQLTNTRVNDTHRIGMVGFDLGASFETPEGLVFLFGDTWVYDQSLFNLDSIALTRAISVERFVMPKLNWAVTQNHWAPLKIPNENYMLGFEVPTDGFHLNGRNYFFFSSGWNEERKVHSHMGLASLQGILSPSTQMLWRHPSSRFINISIVEKDGMMYLFGAGTYRASALYLARVPKRDVLNHAAWRYYRGNRNDAPVWGEREETAIELTREKCLGEISVKEHKDTGLFILTYNCFDRGIFLRTAYQPWGPWSEPVQIFDGTVHDHGYHNAMHENPAIARYHDGLSEAIRQADEVNGGPYGAYLIPRWFRTPQPSVHELVYTLSTWHPYQVHLFKTVVKSDPTVQVNRPVYGGLLPLSKLEEPDFTAGLTGWKQQGDLFRTIRRGQEVHLTTFNDQAGGDKTKGRLYQSFKIDASTNELIFKIYGGHAAVRLFHRNEMVRQSRGGDEFKTTQVRWSLHNLRGETVTLSVDDDQEQAWGFIEVGPFEFTYEPQF